jgi:hypothetical protein
MLNRILLLKPVAAQIAKEFLVFHGTRSFITVTATACLSMDYILFVATHASWRRTI